MINTVSQYYFITAEHLSKIIVITLPYNFKSDLLGIIIYCYKQDIENKIGFNSEYLKKKLGNKISKNELHSIRQ